MPSYEKNKKSGLWSARFRETSLKDGQIHQVRLSGFKTKKEAQYGYETYLIEYNKKAEENKNNTIPKENPAKIRFSVLVENYLAFKKARVKKSSFYDVDKKVRNKILPYFKNVSVEDVTPALVLEWQLTLTEYSYAYQKTLVTHLASIYNYAEKYHNIPNIMDKVDRPRNLQAKKEMLFYTPDEFRKMIKEVESIVYSLYYKMLYLSGCRRGEALALTWEDISFDNNTVKISKTLSFKVGESGKPYHIGPPKTPSSNRTVILPQFYMNQLKEYKTWQTENESNIEFVFGADTPLPPTSIERHLTKAASKAEVKRIRIHDLRHSCASLLLHKGVTIVALSKHLGHSSVKETLDTYSHMLPDDQTMIIKSLETVSDI